MTSERKLDQESGSDNATALLLDELFVQQAYASVSEQFTLNRVRLWRSVSMFLTSQNGLVLDVGCGNGKYLTKPGTSKSEKSYDGKTNRVYGPLPMIGCDPCPSLVTACQHAGYNCVVADTRYLPFKNAGFNGAICVAVLHHLVAAQWRLQAIREMHRVINVGGRVLLLVWGLELWQASHGRRKLQLDDVLKLVENKDERALGAIAWKECVIALSQQDFLVPWVVPRKQEIPRKTKLNIPNPKKMFYGLSKSERRRLVRQLRKRDESEKLPRQTKRGDDSEGKSDKQNNIKQLDAVPSMNAESELSVWMVDEDSTSPLKQLVMGKSPSKSNAVLECELCKGAGSVQLLTSLCKALEPLGVVLRFYHFFRQGELELLVTEFNKTVPAGFQVAVSGRDKQNWFCELRKLPCDK